MKSILAATILLMLLAACSETYPNRDVVGERFPTVQGNTLAEEPRTIPGDLVDSAAVFLVGYKQDSQFDIDRWLIGLDQTGTRLPAYELPTIQGLFPRMFETQIDAGMRRGIPKELWGGVITIYEDGETVQRFTGNTNPNNARVLLVDAAGTVRWFHDEGFSVPALNGLRAAAEALGGVSVR